MFLKSDDIQPLVNLARFLVVPLKKQVKQGKSLNFKRIQGFIFFLQRQKVGFQSIFASENRGTFFDLGFRPTVWRIFALIHNILPLDSEGVIS